MTSSVLAGPGLLRSGNILSLNPNVSLQNITTKNLSVQTQLIVPEPLASNQAATKNYVDNFALNNGLVQGDGISIQSGTVSLNKDIILNSVILTGISDNTQSAVTKSYVDNAVQPLALQSYVDDNIADVVRQGDYQADLQLLATRTYVGSFMQKFATEDDVTNAVSSLVNTSDFASALSNKADLSYVQDALSRCAKTTDLQNVAASIPDISQFQQSLTGLATTFDVNNSISNAINNAEVDILSQVSSQIQESVSSLATKDDISQLSDSIVTIDSLNSAIADTKIHLDSLMVGTVQESYVDDAVASLASKTYVDTKTNAVSNKVASYVDNALQSASFPQVYPIQYVQPNDGDTIELNGSTLVVIAAINELNALTVTFPNTSKDGKYFMITTLNNVVQLSYSNLTIVGGYSIGVGNGLAPGQTQKWVYLAQENGWIPL